MKNVKYLLLLLPIAIVVLTSGCTGSGGPKLGNGIEISEFRSTFSQVFSGDDVQLLLKFQNVGEERTTGDVFSRIYGVDPVLWQLKNQNNIQSTDFSVYQLRAPDEEYGTEGGIGNIHYTMKAPCLSEGTSQTYDVSARVYYYYKTSASKKITIVNEEELRRRVLSSEAISSASITDVSRGPISVNIVTGDYIRSEDDPTMQDGYKYIFPVTITISKISQGEISPYPEYLGQQGFTEDYLLKMYVNAGKANLDISPDCKKYITGDIIRLWEGGTSITCEFIIMNPPLIEEERTLEMSLEYPYYIDASTSIIVNGRRGCESSYF